MFFLRAFGVNDGLIGIFWTEPGLSSEISGSHRDHRAHLRDCKGMVKDLIGIKRDHGCIRLELLPFFKDDYARASYLALYSC